MEASFLNFFESAVYMFPHQYFKACSRHQIQQMNTCDCLNDDKKVYSLGYSTCWYFPRRVHFSLWFQNVDKGWDIVKKHPLFEVFKGVEVWDLRFCWCKDCYNGEPGTRLWELIDHYNGTAIKTALSPVLSPRLPVPHLVRIVNDYLPIGKEVPIACWECIEVNELV